MMTKPPPEGLETDSCLPTYVDSLVDLLVKTVDDGSLYRFPNILDHPEEMRYLHTGHICQLLHLTEADQSSIRVAYFPGDNASPNVVGYSCWRNHVLACTRHGASCVLDKRTFEQRLVCRGLSDDMDLLLRDIESRTLADKPPEPFKSLTPNKVCDEAVRKMRRRAPESATKTRVCLELCGLAVREEYQRQGIASQLLRYGTQRGRRQRMPIFVTAEGRGLEYYQKGHGFQILAPTQWWLDRNGQEVTREEVDNGNEAWRTQNGGLCGAEMVWLPHGLSLHYHGRVYVSDDLAELDDGGYCLVHKTKVCPAADQSTGHVRSGYHGHGGQQGSLGKGGLEGKEVAEPHKPDETNEATAAEEGRQIESEESEWELDLSDMVDITEMMKPKATTDASTRYTSADDFGISCF